MKNDKEKILICGGVMSKSDFGISKMNLLFGLVFLFCRFLYTFGFDSFFKLFYAVRLSGFGVKNYLKIITFCFFGCTSIF